MGAEPTYDDLPSGLVAPVRLDPTGRGGPTEAQARGPRWRRTSQGYYVPASVDAEVPEQRIVEAGAVVPEVAGITGWAGLRWLGATWFSGLAADGLTRRPVVIVTADANVRDQAGISISQERLLPGEVTFARGLPVTLPWRSASFEARYAATLTEATVAWDMAAFADLVSLQEAQEFCAAHPGWTGIPQARDALALAVENSWSPMETRLRLIWVVEAGRHTPLCNVPLFDRSGRHIGTPDLLDPEAGVIGEYDGSLHLHGARRSRDLVREGRFRDHGLEVVTVVANDVQVTGRVADRIDAAYRRVRPTPIARRTWTLDRPPRWRDTSTVVRRRELAHAGLTHLLPNRPRVA